MCKTKKQFISKRHNDCNNFPFSCNLFQLDSAENNLQLLPGYWGMRPCSVVFYLATLFTFGRQSLGLKPGLFNGRDGFLLSKANFQTLKDQQKTHYFCNLQNICRGTTVPSGGIRRGSWRQWNPPLSMKRYGMYEQTTQNSWRHFEKGSIYLYRRNKFSGPIWWLDMYGCFIAVLHDRHERQKLKFIKGSARQWQLPICNDSTKQKLKHENQQTQWIFVCLKLNIYSMNIALDHFLCLNLP